MSPNKTPYLSVRGVSEERKGCDQKPTPCAVGEGDQGLVVPFALGPREYYDRKRGLLEVMRDQGPRIRRCLHRRRRRQDQPRATHAEVAELLNRAIR
jgi:hypothetical protein